MVLVQSFLDIAAHVAGEAALVAAHRFQGEKQSAVVVSWPPPAAWSFPFAN